MIHACMVLSWPATQHVLGLKSASTAPPPAHTGLRAAEDQALLAELAQCPNVHLAASVDHVGAALLWTPVVQARFRWVRVQAHTHRPYVAEMLDKPSVLLGGWSGMIGSVVLCSWVFQSYVLAWCCAGGK